MIIDFESILVPEVSGKKTPDEAYTNKYQKHVTSSYGYEIMCVDDKFGKPFKSTLVKDIVCKFYK